MRRILTATIGLLLAIGLTAGSTVAHHDGEGNLPPNNPHSFGIPQEFWDAGIELFVVGFDCPVFPCFAVLDDGIDWESGNFWIPVRVGGPEGQYFAVKLQNWISHDIAPIEDINEIDLYHPTSGDPVTDWDYIQFYPHPHALVLNAGTSQERCIDLAGGQSLSNPNQHNNMHVGAPSHTTPGGFQKAGHEIHYFSCADMT